MAIVLGVDSSTQSVKVEARDVATGELLSTGRASHPSTTPPRSEQSPLAWWEAFVSACCHTLGSIDRNDVVAISVAGQQHGMVALDAHGDAVHPAKLWNDTESAPDADSLLRKASADEWAAAVGSVPVAAFTVTKLAWLRRNHPESYARMASVILPHDEFNRRLTGRLTTDRGDASGTGYWSPATGSWRIDMLAHVDPIRDWASALPVVIAPFDAIGPLTDAASQTLGLSTTVLVGAGTGDNMGAALGLGLAPGDVVISLGTSGTVYAVSDTPTADATGAVAGFADATGRFLPLVCTLNAMKVTDAAARLLGVDHEGFEALVLDAPAGADGLVLVPYFDGERTPNRPNATGTLMGIRSDVSRASFARAAVEGVVCGLLDGLDALRAAGVRTNGRLLLIGGGSRSAAFRRVVADLAGRDVTVPTADEHVAIGAALQAAVMWTAVTTDADPDLTLTEMRTSWNVGGGETTVPDRSVDAAAIRAAYAAARG
jgi:xylulokinase